MREIVSIHIGETGLRIGQQYWHTLAHEHSLDPSSGQIVGDDDSQIENLNKVFDENSSGVYTPRAVFVDATPFSLDQMYHDESVISNCQRVWGSTKFDPASWFSDGRDYVFKYLKEDILKSINKEIEKCESLDTVLIFASICGGTGSAIVAEFTKIFKDSINFILVPNNSRTSTPAEIYNATC